MSIESACSFYVPNIRTRLNTCDPLENSLITTSGRSWMLNLEPRYPISPLVAIFNHAIVRAFSFDPSCGFIPVDAKTLSDKAKNLGLDLSKKQHTDSFVIPLPCEESNLFFTTPFKMGLFTDKKGFNLVTNKKCFVIEITHEGPPNPFLSIPMRFDPQITCFFNLEGALKAYRSRFCQGSYKLIDESFLEKITTFFFQRISYLNDYLALSQNLFVLTSNSLNISVVISKTTKLDVYAFFLDRSWQGSYKTVYLGLHLTDRIYPVGLSLSDISTSVTESKKEIFFRKHPEISKVLTPLYLTWHEKDKDAMIHEWAGLGSLSSFLKSQDKKPLPILDKIALEMLKCLHTFHQNGAVHKDLSCSNFIIDEKEGHTHLFINDVGSSCLYTEERALSTMSTHSRNLAPELLRECLATQRPGWTEPFSVPFNFQDWVYGERFQIGRLIATLYLGQDPYFLISSKKDFLESLLTERRQFTDFFSDSKTFMLDKHLNEAQQKKLKAVYQDAYAIYYQILSNSPVHPDTLDTDSYLAYLSSFEKTFNSETRAILSPYLSDHNYEIAQKLYTKAYKTLYWAYENQIDSELAQFTASNTTPILELLPKMDPAIEARMRAINPILNLDSTQRPDLLTIIAALEAAILS